MTSRVRKSHWLIKALKVVNDPATALSSAGGAATVLVNQSLCLTFGILCTIPITQTTKIATPEVLASPNLNRLGLHFCCRLVIIEMEDWNTVQ